MTPHPYCLALLLALATVTGLVGLMLLDGWWQVPCFVLAATPATAGAVGHWRARRALLAGG